MAERPPVALVVVENHSHEQRGEGCQSDSRRLRLHPGEYSYGTVLVMLACACKCMVPFFSDAFTCYVVSADPP